MRMNKLPLAKRTQILAMLVEGSSMRSITRLTNAFAKKFDNHVHALALYFAFYNFCRIHKTLKVTPAMAAGITDRLWSLEDIVARIDADAPAPKPRGPYKKAARP
jgi:hypothetical protein